MWARAYTCGQLMSSMLVHVWSVCSREWQQSEDSGGLATPPTPIPFSGPFLFHVLFLETRVKRKSNRDSHPQGCCLQRGEAVWVRARLREWSAAVRATVRVSDGVHGFIGLFFFNNKVSFLLLFSVSLAIWVESGKVHKGLQALPC